jgi:hypothetical protein
MGRSYVVFFLSCMNGLNRARNSKSHMKTMLITFFHIKFIVQLDFIPRGQTVNQAYYV